MATADTHSTARLEDVAALANVSLATASKALHGKPRVSEDTRERVMEAARQLNYSPNKLAQSLASGRSGTIGLVTSDLQGRFSTPILIGAENELRAQSTSVLLANARGDDALERSHVEKLLSLKVDGLLIVQCETNPRPSLGRDWGVPLVYVYGPSTDTNDCSVTCDNVDAGRYKLWTEIGLIYKESSLTPAGRSFLEFVASPYGAQLLRANGLLPSAMQNANR